jgi:alcohol dehydrogenase (cytochrome c)
MNNNYLSGVSVAGATALLTVMLAAPAQAAVSDSDIANDAKTTGDVVTWGMGLTAR